ncbi:MAG: large subunit ribosomal protein L30 [Bradymonadia bacterium]|jgi:large subunit ribosomal protein L30
MAKVQVQLTRSPIGRSGSQKATLGALGLRRMNQTVEHNDTAGFRGQIDKVKHLVTCTVIEG